MEGYGGVTARTNIDIDDDLVAAVMSRYRVESKRSAVDFALRQLVREPLTTEEILAMRGSGFEADEEIEGDWAADGPCCIGSAAAEASPCATSVTA